MERRQYDRMTADNTASISLDGKRYSCTIHNYSQRGALVCVEKSREAPLDRDQMGCEVFFENTDGLPELFCGKGRIVRFLDDGGSIYMAICFI